MNTTIAINKPKVRQSNFELLRIIAMFMVLILHADFVALGAPNKTEIIAHPCESAIRIFLEVACVVAVNIFVLISGWFGIRVSKKGFYKFLFQVLFFTLGIYIPMLILGKISVNIDMLSDILSFRGLYWFIPAYLCLFIISPILNSFLECFKKSSLLLVIILFFVLQTVFLCLNDGGGFLSNGYSALSFAGLYLIAGYLKRYVDNSTTSKAMLLLWYLIITLLQTVLYMFFSYRGLETKCMIVIAYSNPFVILAAILLLVLFSRIDIQNRLINWAGESAFAVYLFHSSPVLFYTYYISQISSTQSYGLRLCLVVTWFIIAILLDQVRKIAWKGFYSVFQQK